VQGRGTGFKRSEGAKRARQQSASSHFVAEPFDRPAELDILQFGVDLLARRTVDDVDRLPIAPASSAESES
jgi:hypothetical protein